MSSSFDIDFEFCKIQRIKKYNVFFCNLILHTSITLIITLFDESGRQIHSIQKLIEGEEYEAWGLDDFYLDEIVRAELDKIKCPLLEEVSLDNIL
tara:strand:- start:193 stop:477 length:285 start_codon:yes stop_codon:yes gene_type:complete